MSKHLVSVASIAVALMFACAAMSAEEKKEGGKKNKYELSCPVSGKAATKDHAAKYKEGEVYFCCDNCPKAFEKDTAKFAAKANAQLVGTRQYREVKCPLTGKPLNKETVVDVAGTKVSFCCNGCKGKVESAEGDKKLELVFSEAAFEKGFKPVKKKGEKKGEE